jgi:NTP pyrophosphatase (non-canonical NTP hydrolase)
MSHYDCKECGKAVWEECSCASIKDLTLEEYSARVWKAYPITDITINALGLCGEAGEFANKLKKRLYKDVPDAELIDELGDVLWHVAQCATLLKVDLKTLMGNSLAKTEARNIKP